MHSYVQGFRPPDDEWHRMKDVWDACQVAGVPAPVEVERFFDGSTPDPHGNAVDVSDAVSPWRGYDTQDGFEVDLTKLPEGLTVIRFVNSW